MKDDSQIFGKWMAWGAWIIVIGFLTVVFNDILDQQRNPNQSINSLTNLSGITEIRLKRNRSGYYVANGSINQQSVEFLLDTGATDVAIPLSVAKNLNLKKGRQIVYRTANGNTVGYQTILDEISLGDISLSNIRGGVTPSMGGKQVLLGMTFLKHLEFTQRGDTLIIRQYPENKF